MKDTEPPVEERFPGLRSPSYFAHEPPDPVHLVGITVSVIIIMTAVTILRQPAIAAAFIVGNVTGGLAATIAYLLVTLFPSPAFLLLVVLLFGLIFGGKIREVFWPRCTLSG